MKKGIIKALSFLLCLQMFCMSFAYAAGTGGEESSAEDKHFEKVFSVLSWLDIVTLGDGESFDGTRVVTRAEFCEYVGKAMKIEPYFQRQYYADVPREHWASGYINVMADLGIVSLNEEQLFEPDRAITYPEICKILLYMMGYGSYVQQTSMHAWVTEAYNRDIAISVADSESVTAKEALTSLYNAMYEPVLAVISITSDGAITAQVNGDTNLFFAYHNIRFGRGQLKGFYGARLTDVEMPREGAVNIDGREYLIINGVDMENQLGGIIEFVYHTADDIDTVIYADGLRDNQAVDITSDAFEGFDETNYAFRYYSDLANGRQRTAAVDQYAQIIFNGVPSDKTMSDAVAGFADGTRRGSIRLINTDTSGGADIVIIKSYQPFVLTSANTGEKMLYGGFEQTAVDYGAYEIVNIVDENQTSMELPTIEEGTVLNLAESDNNEVIEIVVSQTQLDITISSVQASEEIGIGGIVVADDVEYKIDDDLWEINSGAFLSHKQFTGKLDMFGYIVDADFSGSETFQLGYVFAGTTVKNTFDEQIMLRMYTTEKEIQNYPLSQTIKIDGLTYKLEQGAETVIAALPGAAASSLGAPFTLEPQVMRYKLNEAQEITELDTLRLTEQEDKDTTLQRRWDQVTLLYNNRLGLDTYYSSSVSTLFVVPELDDMGRRTSEPGFGTYPKASDFDTTYSFQNDYYYVISSYDYGVDDLYTDVLVLQMSSIVSQRDAYVYQGLSEAVDENNEVYTVLRAWNNGGEEGLRIEPEFEQEIADAGLRFGDIFFVQTNSDGTHIYSVEKAFDAETLQFTGERATPESQYWWYGTYSPYSNWDYRNGSSSSSRNNLSKMWVYKRAGNALYGTYEQSDLWKDEYNELFSISGVPVTIVDSVRGEIYSGQTSDIIGFEEVGGNCSFLIAETRMHRPTDFVIYK